VAARRRHAHRRGVQMFASSPLLSHRSEPRHAITAQLSDNSYTHVQVRETDGPIGHGTATRGTGVGHTDDYDAR
jgi:hypothetical protein